MNEEELRAELERVKAENEALKKRGQLGGSTMLKVSEKGAVSVYGLGKFPITLYSDQWKMLLAQAEMIEQFLVDHQDRLARKEG